MDLAQMSVTIGIMPRVTLSLSDRYIFLPGHPEQLCAQPPTNGHTFRTLKSARGSYPRVFSFLSLTDCHRLPVGAALLTRPAWMMLGGPREQGWPIYHGIVWLPVVQGGYVRYPSSSQHDQEALFPTGFPSPSMTRRLSSQQDSLLPA